MKKGKINMIYIGEITIDPTLEGLKCVSFREASTGSEFHKITFPGEKFSQ